MSCNLVIIQHPDWCGDKVWGVGEPFCSTMLNFQASLHWTSNHLSFQCKVFLPILVPAVGFCSCVSISSKLWTNSYLSLVLLFLREKFALWLQFCGGSRTICWFIVFSVFFFLFWEWKGWLLSHYMSDRE